MAEVSVDAPFTDTIESVEGLRQLYRQPTELVAEKKLDHIAPWARAMVGAARFVFLATADGDGRTTVSPKGGTPGFVRVLDEHHVAIPDFAGNNLLDSLENIVANPAIGLIFLMPGRPETLRVGRRRVHHDSQPEVLARWAEDGRPPKTAIGVRGPRVVFHCPASFQRAELWEPDSWDADSVVRRVHPRCASHATSGPRGRPSDGSAAESRGGARDAGQQPSAGQVAGDLGARAGRDGERVPRRHGRVGDRRRRRRCGTRRSTSSA